MKKLIQIVIFALVFFIGTNIALAKTNTIELGEVIPGIRLHLKTPTVEKNKNIFKIINRNTNELVYCIEPGVILQNGSYTEYQYVNFFPIQISQEDWNAISLIAYYGYQYGDRTDIKWYVITQVMIWEYILQDSDEIYFIDENNQRIELYEEERKAILTDIKSRELFPSFAQKEYDGIAEYTIKLKEELVLEDEYNVLDQFEVKSNNNLIVPNIDKNKITITADYPVSGDVILSFRQPCNTSAFPKLFYSANSQAVMSRGQISMPTFFTQIKVLYPSFELQKKDMDTLSPIAGAKYGIYYETGDLYKTITTNAEGLATLDEIYFGNFYLQEIEAPYGYEINNEKIYFEVKDEDIYLEVMDKKLEKQIEIQKYMETKSGDLIPEANAEFIIYNENTGEEVTQKMTDEKGKITLSLPYGKYRLVQVAGSFGYEFIEDVILDINENFEEETLILKNKQIVGSLEITKLDAFTNDAISNVEFGLYDKDMNFLTSMVTDSSGILLFENLDLGTYYIKELAVSNNYELMDDAIEISIVDGGKVSLTIENRMKIEVPKTGTNEFLYVVLLYLSLLITGGFTYCCGKEK